MIDSVALTWGHAIGSSPRRVDSPKSGRRAELVAEPVRLDFERLVEELGSDEGQVRSIRYGDKRPEFGHWKVGDVELLYREGRLELRASLPKLLTGRNDVVLDERGVHDGLRELIRHGEELAHHPLDLREAVPTRLDYCWQWSVPSVSWVLEHLKTAYAPPRKKRNEIISPKGGRSLVFGYDKGRRTIRFYDKVGELTDRGEHSEHDLDTLLRYEIQERRRPRLRLVHERGYSAVDVHRELEHGVASIASIAARDVEAIIEACQAGWWGELAYTLGGLYLVEHQEAFPIIRRFASKNTYYAWRRRARALRLQVADWAPVIPLDELRPGSSFWSTHDQAA